MPRKNKLLASVLTVMLAGCAATQLPAASQRYNPSDSARIRLFGQNQKPTLMTVQTGQGANNESIEINVGGGIGDAFGSMLGTVKNESIGIPETENTRSLASKNGILSKTFYREFVIPAGKPVKIRNAFIGLGSAPLTTGFGTQRITYNQRHCNSSWISFTPQAGKDYEVASYANPNGCAAVVFNIQTREGKTVLTPIPTQVD